MLQKTANQTALAQQQKQRQKVRALLVQSFVSDAGWKERAALGESTEGSGQEQKVHQGWADLCGKLQGDVILENHLEGKAPSGHCISYASA